MSDFNDVLYDPRIHTHTSCVDEVAGCDVVVLLVGSRYGGSAVPDSLLKIDFDFLERESKSIDTLKTKDNISVTQLEVLKAVEQGIPVFSFVDERVWHDHALYEKNKGKPIIDQIEFPSIQRKETAAFIFEFINFLRHRVRNNSVFTFAKTQDIEETLRRQWSGLLQRLINEQRRRITETARIDSLSAQLADLRVAILTTISSSDGRKIAQGVVRFRRLVEFVRALKFGDQTLIFSATPVSWKCLLTAAGIVDAFELPDGFQGSFRQVRTGFLMIKEDRTFYECRFPREALDDLELDWVAFCEFPVESRRAIVEALHERPSGMPLMRYIREPVDMYLHKRLSEYEKAQEKLANEPDE